MAGVRIPSVVLQHQCALRGIDGEAIGFFGVPWRCLASSSARNERTPAEMNENKGGLEAGMPNTEPKQSPEGDYEMDSLFSQSELVPPTHSLFVVECALGLV